MDTLETAVPLEDDAVEALVEAWRHNGALYISGPAGSGRSAVAEALCRARGDGIPMVRGDVPPTASTRPGWILDDLGLATASETLHVPVNALAARIAAQLGQATIIVRGADWMDQRSLRVLLALGRQRAGIAVLLIGEAGPTAESAFTAPPQIQLDPVDGENLAQIAQRMLGGELIDLDLRWLEDLTRGSFRALCWTLESLRRSGAVHRSHGGIRLGPFNELIEDLPDWSIREDLVKVETAQYLSLSGALPVAVLEKLGELEDLAVLEAAGDVVVSDGSARLAVGAVAEETHRRMSVTGRRYRITRILEAASDDELEEVDSIRLAGHVLRAGLPVPAQLASAAVSEAAHTGLHPEAVHVANASAGPFDARARCDLAYSLTVMDRTQEAVVLLRGLADEGSDPGTLGMIAALGVMRRPERRENHELLADLLRTVERTSSRATAIVEACSRLLRTGPPVDVSALKALVESAEVPAMDRVCALELLAVEAWTDGRPRESLRILETLQDHEPPSAIHRAVRCFLESASELLVPDIRASLGRLVSQSRPDGIPRTVQLMRAGVGLHRGHAGRSFLISSTVLNDASENHDEVLAPLFAALSSIAASMLHDPHQADELLEASYNLPSPSHVLEAATEHARAIAATQMQPTPHLDEGLALYASAAMAAETLNFRLLRVFASYRWAHQLSVENRGEQWEWLSAQLDGERPLDGIPSMLARMGRGIEVRDIRMLISFVGDLQSSGFFQDAKALSAWLVGRAGQEIPSAARRGLARLVRIRVLRPSRRPGPDLESVLTRRERDVADLILEGLTDAVIAERLHISRRTVTTHVGRILQKLGISSRRDLTHDIV